MKNFLLTWTPSHKAVWFGLVMMVAFGATPARSQTFWQITSTADSTTDTTTLRGAVMASHNGDYINMQGLTGTITLTYGEIFVSTNISIVGSGASTLAINGNNSSRVFDIGSDANVYIGSLTIENGNGYISATIPDDNGGGIRNTGALTLVGCVFSGNSATSIGGGLYIFPGKSFSVLSTTFSNNSAVSGGAVYNDGGGGSFSEDTVSNNYASSSGGGVYFNGSGFTDFENTTISGNVAGTTTALGSGAGIYVASPYQLVVNTSAVTGNSIVFTTSGGSPGGSAITNFGGLRVFLTTISGNSGNAGGVWNAGTLTVTNATLSQNDTGILNQATASVINNTIAGNTLGIVNNENGVFSVKNTLLANNPSANCTDNGTITSADHNLSDDATCTAAFIQPHDFPPLTPAGLDPAGLKHNSTAPFPFVYGDTIALEPGSVAVNAINPASDCTVDDAQNGESRPQGTFCDIGSYEAPPDFYFSPISPFTAGVGGSGSAGVLVNSFVEFSSPVTLTSSALPGGFTASFTGNPATPPVDGSVSSTLSVGIASTVAPGPYSFNVVGTSAALSHSVSVNVTVGIPPAITSANSATFTVGTAGFFTVKATGTPTPSLTESGALPTGVLFNAATGVLSGTPAAGSGSTYNIVFQATNGFAPPAVQNFLLIVDVNGNLTVSSGQTYTFTDGKITGNLTMNGGTVVLNNSTVNGNLQMNAGSLTIASNSLVQGNVQISGASTYSISSSRINGNLQIQSLPASSAQNQICGATVNGNLQFQSNGSAVLIGSPTCPGNTVAGNVQVSNNSAATQVYGNTISGNLQVTSNTAATQVDNNTVRGNLQVQNNSSSAAIFTNSAKGILQCSGNNASLISGGGNTAALKQGQCASF